MLKEKLNVEQLRYFLTEILSFTLNEEYDDDGEEFYANEVNEKFDLSTLEGIINYALHRAEESGKWKAKYEIRQAIGF